MAEDADAEKDRRDLADSLMIAETAKLLAEEAKLLAEVRKMRIEAFFYPLVVVSGTTLAVVGVLRLFL